MLTMIRSYVLALLLVITALLTTVFLWPAMFRRDWALFVTRHWGGQLLFLMKLICGLDYRVEHEERIPAGPALIASNHQSMWETFAISWVLKKPCFVLKKELLSIPVFGWWFRACDFIAIDRKAGASSMRLMLEAAQARLDDGYQIVIFPEGSRLPPGETGPFHPGVAGLYRGVETGCIPVAHNSGDYFIHPGVRREPGTITLSFLPKIGPGLKRGDFLKQLKQEIDTEALRIHHMGAAARETRTGGNSAEISAPSGVESEKEQ